MYIIYIAIKSGRNLKKKLNNLNNFLNCLSAFEKDMQNLFLEFLRNAFYHQKLSFETEAFEKESLKNRDRIHKKLNPLKSVTPIETYSAQP